MTNQPKDAIGPILDNRGVVVSGDVSGTVTIIGISLVQVEWYHAKL